MCSSLRAYDILLSECTFDLLSMSLLGFFTMSPPVTIEIVDPVVISNRRYVLSLSLLYANGSDVNID